MIKQTNTENVGIEDLKQPGYAHDDGLVIPEHWVYEALKNDFDFLARDLVATFKFKNVLDIGSGPRQLASGLDLIDLSIEKEQWEQYLASKDMKKLEISILNQQNWSCRFGTTVELIYKVFNE